jgi:cell wall-associated NlpC family hydrolase
MPRRVRLIVFLGVITMLVLATGISAGAQSSDVQSKESEIAAAQQRLMELRTEQSVAQAAYDDALFRMNELNVKIAEADKDLNAAEEQLAVAQRDLESRAAEVYKSGNVAFINVLMGVENFSQFATRLDLWMRLLGEEKAEVEAVLKAKEDLEARKSALETERVRRAEAVEEALVHKENAAAAEAEAEAYLNSLNGELQAAIQAEEERQAAAARAAAAEAPEPEPQPEPQLDPEARERAIAEAAAVFAAQQRAQLAAERAAAAKQRAEEKAAEEAAEQAAIEAAAAQQALAEERAAKRAAERRAELRAERRAERKAELQAEREAEREAKREALRAERLAERRAEKRAARQASASALAAAASASAAAAADTGSGGGGGGGGGGGASGSGSAVIAEGQRYLGVPYRLGTCNPRVGMDCSCFTMLVYQEFGISLPDNPAAQWSYGRPVRGAPAAGDLLFWAEGGGGITHVGIAMGDGTTIHASVYAGEVVQGTPIDAIPGYVGARRLL